MDNERDDEAHPAYARIIAQLAPDEAQFLYRLRNADSYVQIEEQRRRRGFEGEIDDLEKEQPGERYRSLSDENPSDFIHQYERLDWLQFPANISVYIGHLDSLGIVQMRPSFGDDRRFIDPDTKEIQLEMSKIFVLFTPFGLKFALACVPDSPEDEWGW